MTETAQTAIPHAASPPQREVQALLRQAAAHPMGTRYLKEGQLDAVAATFGVHAFVVDAARDALARRMGGMGHRS